MKKYQMLVRGKNVLGQLGLGSQVYVEDYTSLGLFEGHRFKQIATNMGQTFLLNESSKLIR